MTKNESPHGGFPLLVLVLALAVLGVVLMVVPLAFAAPQAEPQALPSELPSRRVLAAVVTGTLNVVDSDSNAVYGPFLQGQLGSEGGGIFDIEVTADGSTAMVSNFGDGIVNFVDVSNPISPSFITSVTVGFFAEDLGLTPDSKYLLVTDGGFTSRIATINVVSRSLVYTAELGAVGYAQAVEAAPDGTVVVADRSSGMVHTLVIDAAGALTYANSYSYTVNQLTGEAVIGQAAGGDWILPHPTNVAIAPDGRTVIVNDASPYTTTTVVTETVPLASQVGVYVVTAPGVLSFTSAVTNLTLPAQAITFNPRGTKAFLSTNGGSEVYGPNDSLSVLNIAGPGVVTLNTELAANLHRWTNSMLFGVDTIATAGNKAFVSNPTVYGSSTSNLAVVSLLTHAVTGIPMPGIPTGVKAIPTKRTYIPLAVRAWSGGP